MKENFKTETAAGLQNPVKGPSRSSFIFHPSSFRLAFIVALPTAVLWAIAFPPFNQAWAVLVFLTPFIKWAFARPQWKIFLLTALGAGWGGWFLILIWLRHIYPPWGWLAVALLSGYLGLYILVWLAALRWVAPRLDGAPRWQRLVGLFALAGLWVVLDWVRGWLFSGFAWLPLAAAFWKFPVFLQALQWTGSWSVTFAIVLGNLGLVCGTGLEPEPAGAPTRKRKIFWPARIGPELLAPFILFVGFTVIATEQMYSSARQSIPLLRAGLVQPATMTKWTSDSDPQKIWDTLLNLSQKFIYQPGSRNNVDLVLWPEAAPPFILEATPKGDYRELIEKVADSLGRPLLLGAVADSTAAQDKTSSLKYDGVYVVQPKKGFVPEFYAKRHLVPFGEYNPLAGWLPHLKVVQMMGDTVPGTHTVTIPVVLADGRAVLTGPLVCYEDVFPNLARDQAKAGAELIVVVTNDAYYGTGGGSLQHAAHSVLRAIETRRPVIRCGNEGWSGFIDQDGNAFELEKEGSVIKAKYVLFAKGTTYFQGTGTVVAYSNPQFDHQQTFYVRHGDWFVALAGLLTMGGWVVLRQRRG